MAIFICLFFFILPVKMVGLLQQHANTVYWLQTEALCKLLPLPIAAKSSILNVAEFMGPSLKTLPCVKTSPVLCEISLISYYFEMWPP